MWLSLAPRLSNIVITLHYKHMVVAVPHVLEFNYYMRNRLSRFDRWVSPKPVLLSVFTAGFCFNTTREMERSRSARLSCLKCRSPGSHCNRIAWCWQMWQLYLQVDRFPTPLRNDKVEHGDLDGVLDCCVCLLSNIQSSSLYLSSCLLLFVSCCFVSAHLERWFVGICGDTADLLL